MNSDPRLRLVPRSDSNSTGATNADQRTSKPTSGRTISEAEKRYADSGTCCTTYVAPRRPDGEHPD